MRKGSYEKDLNIWQSKDIAKKKSFQKWTLDDGAKTQESLKLLKTD